jgi:hypothetical protein
MNPSLRLAALLLLQLCFLPARAQAPRAPTPALTAKDLRPLVGEWTGTLTYLDYTTRQPYAMPADVSIRRLATRGQLLLVNQYPNEPKANRTDTLALGQQGRLLDHAPVTAKFRLADGSTQIVTEYVGTDGNDHQKALIRHTYTLGRRVFVNRKDVRFDGSSEWVNRHEYRYTRAGKNEQERRQ